GFVGVSNLIERDGERLTIRPEKIELLEAGSEADGLHVESGRIVDVSYAGMITRFTVRLESGESLQLVRQNVESASAGALPGQGSEVLVGWRPEHAAVVGGKSNKEEVAP
ncbi:MAG TPA: TOBE domain-containing protein, partial [Solirubrobacterales bacterium]|nr:TOBE domain-containing protein [Solirubrobacterales bacterium]